MFLAGCSVPVILRTREEGGFYVVGDLYVEGIMDGEAMATISEKDWVELEIH